LIIRVFFFVVKHELRKIIYRKKSYVLLIYLFYRLYQQYLSAIKDFNQNFNYLIWKGGLEKLFLFSDINVFFSYICNIMAFELAQLKYAYTALEPHIDARTMEIHHTKHHAAYTTNLNGAIAGTALESASIEEILKGVSAHSAVVRNNGGGFYNHNLYWDVIAPGGSPKPEGVLLDAINDSFGSLQNFQEAFTKAAVTRFGSGWAWLVLQNKKLVVSSTPNQDNPLMDVAEVQGTPILGIDVWEHAYYLNYQNRRPDYVNAFWNLINWDEVARRFKG
jgi:Fe-Mn family superoxide dismutase